MIVDFLELRADLALGLLELSKLGCDFGLEVTMYATKQQGGMVRMRTHSIKSIWTKSTPVRP